MNSRLGKDKTGNQIFDMQTQIDKIENIVNNGGSGGGIYDDTEVRALISDNTVQIKAQDTKIKENTAEIEKLKASSGGSSSAEPKFETATVAGNKINVATFNTTNILQKRYIVASQLLGNKYEILLPLITDDPDTGDPSAPPTFPQMLPDLMNNNYIEIYFGCLANCTLEFKTQMTELSSSSIQLTGIKAGKYKLTAKYNLVDPISWQVKLEEN